MVEKYTAKRHQFRQSHTNHMHHVGWAIVSIILISIVMSLWIYAQKLNSENASLRKQVGSTTPIAPSTCKTTGTWTQNQTKQYSVVTSDGNREFLVHVPDNFTNGTYYPMLLFYPGVGATATAAESAYSVDTLPTISVYPAPTIGQGGMTSWQGAPYASGADDVAFTVAIIDKVQSELCIDRTRIYAAGFSNGGGFVAYLSCRISDRIAAYAVAAGAFYKPEGTCVPPKPTPIINVHGDQDPQVPYFGSLPRELPPVESWIRDRAVTNNCNKPTEIRTVTETTTAWNSCDNGTKVQNIRINGGGHAWGQVSNEYIWEFLNQFTL